jgi:hypothetical protein
LSCDRCRKRVTPFSVRFLGRKQHVSAMLVVCSAMLCGLRGRRLRKVREYWGVSPDLAAHWKAWWSVLPVTAFWKKVRGGFSATFRENALPVSLLEVYRGAASERLTSVLRLLLPLTSSSAPGNQAI